MPREKFRTKAVDDLIDELGVLVRIVRKRASGLGCGLMHVGGFVVRGGLRVQAAAIQDRRDAEMQHRSIVIGQRLVQEQPLHGLNVSIGQTAEERGRQPPVGLGETRTNRECIASRLARQLEFTALGLDPGHRNPRARMGRIDPDRLAERTLGFVEPIRRQIRQTLRVLGQRMGRFRW